MKLSSFRSIGRTAAHGIIFGLSTAFTIALVSLVYAATTYYTDLPNTSSGNGLTATSWNNLVNYANKAVKQDTEVLTVTGGKVGIGTTSPCSKLHIGSGGGRKDLVFEDTSGTYNVAYIGKNGNSLEFGDSSANGTLTPESRMTIKLDTGNVGIGTTSPQSTLDVNGDIKSLNTPRAWVTFNGTNLAIYDSYGVSSITRSTNVSVNGAYKINWLKPFSNTYYVVTGACNAWGY